MDVAATAAHSSWMPDYCWAATRTNTRTTCPSSAPRAVPAASRAVGRCPMFRRISRCDTSSPIPAGVPAWTFGPILGLGSLVTPITSRSPEQFRNRRVSGIPEVLRRVRFHTRGHLRTGPSCTHPTARRSTPGYRPRHRQERREIRAGRRVQSRSWCRRRRRYSRRQRHPYRRRPRRRLDRAVSENTCTATY